jgi:hypothetical protein
VPILTTDFVGASGFVGAHILRILLDRGHTVLASVRSQTKADQIRHGYPGVPSSTLDSVVVEDITLEHAYDEALSTTPPVEVVVHAASPLNLNADLANVERDVLRPAILGTTRLLDAVHAHGSSVRRVVSASLGQNSACHRNEGLESVLIPRLLCSGHHIVGDHHYEACRLEVSLLGFRLELLDRRANSFQRKSRLCWFVRALDPPEDHNDQIDSRTMVSQVARLPPREQSGLFSRSASLASA